jgi:UDP-N-acetylmuramyl pentapeptide phosphotransferase/UDP-N-acetylglucosamine-1-phosphate transferase
MNPIAELVLSYAYVLISIGGAAGALAWGLTRWSIGWAHRRRVLAHVEERSSHKVPTPRVGGIGLVAGMMVGVLAAALFPHLAEWLPRGFAGGGVHPVVLAGMAAALAMAFWLGLWDDQSNPPAKAKLAGQLLIAIVPVVAGLRLQEIHVPFGGPDPVPVPWSVGAAVSAGWLLLMMNAVNFMDGINGLAGRFAQGVAVLLLLAGWNMEGAQSLIPLTAAMIGAATGFLLWNTPEAKTFMGDCGSQPLGLMAGMLVLLAAQLPMPPGQAAIPAWSGVLVVAVFVFDVVYTLARRAAAGRNLMEAHREHLYQRHLIATGGDHERTCNFVIGHLWAAGLAGVALARWPGGMAAGWALAWGAAVMVKYAATVWWIERRAAQTP